MTIVTLVLPYHNDYQLNCHKFSRLTLLSICFSPLIFPRRWLFHPYVQKKPPIRKHSQKVIFIQISKNIKRFNVTCWTFRFFRTTLVLRYFGSRLFALRVKEYDVRDRKTILHAEFSSIKHNSLHRSFMYPTRMYWNSLKTNNNSRRFLRLYIWNCVIQFKKLQRSKVFLEISAWRKRFKTC